MHQLLTQYLIQNRQVPIPGIGRLKVDQIPAHFDSVQQKLFPGRLTFNWVPANGGEDASIQPLVGFLSQHSGQPEEDCFDQLQKLSRNISTQLSQEGEWSLPGVGKLVQLAGAGIGFVPEATLDQYLPAVEAGRVVHPNSRHQVMVGDKEMDNIQMQELLNGDESQDEPVQEKWWIASVIIATAAVLLIITRVMKII